MLHPSRRRNVRRILRACEPIPADVITDPDPGGIPSPLRTARVAWAAVRDDATHHLVLQDDVILTTAFAQHLQDVVARWPDHAITLYVNWNSPYNSYRVRCAALAGHPWAAMAPWEWVPTLGLVLPSRHARGLAAYLGTLPGTCTEDDDEVARFCAATGIPVLATVPNLLEHDEGPSLAGSQGIRHATVTAGLPPPGTGYWRGAHVTHEPVPWRYGAVSLFRSACYVRHWALDGQRSLGQLPYPWTRWSQRCQLLGVPRDRIVSAFVRRTPSGRDHNPAIALEFWAAGFMIGAEAGRTAGTRSPDSEAISMRDDALGTWVRSGLDEDDARSLGPAGRRLLGELCAEAVEQGWSFGESAGSRAGGLAGSATVW